MTYMIDARLERGRPSLTLIDAVTGEERLHWRSGNVRDAEHDWQGLFKRLMLLSCANRMSLNQRAESPHFGEECIECMTCVEQDTSTPSSTTNSRFKHTSPVQRDKNLKYENEKFN